MTTPSGVEQDQCRARVTGCVDEATALKALSCRLQYLLRVFTLGLLKGTTTAPMCTGPSRGTHRPKASQRKAATGRR